MRDDIRRDESARDDVLRAEASRRTVAFINLAHALDHFVLLIYPTAVLAIAVERGLDYAGLITLTTGAFIAFGLCSLPMGWIAERVGRRAMLAAFFMGCGAACFGIAACRSSWQFAVGLLVLGIFAAIYHPIGTSMLVSHARHLGRDLSWNGVWGNLGAALASAVTALIAALFGWRWAFVVPGLVCIVVGLAFVKFVPGDPVAKQPAKSSAAAGAAFAARPALLLALFAIAIIAGGMTFNITTIALPKVIDEGIGVSLPLAITGSLATAVFVCGALTQLAVGRLLDRYSLPTIFVALAMLQPVALALAAATTGLPMLLGLVTIMAAIYGQVVVNDAMVARFIPEAYRAKAYSVRYFLGFTASGFAAPLIAWLHARGGFSAVLGAAAGFGVLIALSAVGFWAISSGHRTTVGTLNTR